MPILKISTPFYKMFQCIIQPEKEVGIPILCNESIKQHLNDYYMIFQYGDFKFQTQISPIRILTFRVLLRSYLMELHYRSVDRHFLSCFLIDTSICMATRRGVISDPDLMENVFMKVRKRIEVIFDSLIEKVNERRETFLRQLKEWEEEFNRTRADQFQSVEKIKNVRDGMGDLLAKMTLRQARTSMEKGIEELTTTIDKKEKQIEYPIIRFVCDTQSELVLNFSKFGSLTKETNNVLVKNYTQLSKPQKVFGTFGKEARRFSGARGVVIDNESQRIFIVDKGNSRIQVWSMEGRYLSEFGRGIFKEPWEIALSDDSIYISDYEGQFLSKWCLSTLTLATKSETSKGSEPGQLIGPSGLDIDEEEIFVVESFNKRISVFDLNLKFKRIMANNAMYYSFCLRVRNNVVYIVESTGTVLLFSKSDQLLRTIPKFTPLLSGYICHFNFDSQFNFLMTQADKNCLFIFSPEGDLIHSLNFAEFDLNRPFGIDVSKDGRIVMSFTQGSNAIAIF